MSILYEPYYQFALILILAVVLGGIAKIFLRQPLIISFIAVGILAGPSALNLIHNTEQLSFLAEIGISILLFVVGLKLDLSLIRSIGNVALLTGIGQVIFTSLVGYFISLAIGYSSTHALYIAIALTFSSTIIIVKILSDKKEIDSLHGKISIGLLIVQDLIALAILFILSGLGAPTNKNPIAEIMTFVLRGSLSLIILGVLMKFVIPATIKVISKSTELLTLFSISWAVFVSAAMQYFGMSKEIGAFIAGISLASTQYRDMISGRLVTLRDFLLLFFFINLGAQINLSLLNTQIVPAIILSLFVLIGNPVIMLVIMGTMGYRKRTSFLAGLTVAQISEFSLILASLGFEQGHIDSQTVGLITLVGLITIGLSTYMIMYSNWLFEKLSPFLNVFEKKLPQRESDIGEVVLISYDVILIGLGRYGKSIANSLKRNNYNILGVDFDPLIVNEWQIKGRHAIYGDAEDPELVSFLPLVNSKMVISSLSDTSINLGLLKSLKHNNYKGKIALTVHKQKDGKLLKESGADIILFPFIDAAESVSEKLEIILNENELV